MRSKLILAIIMVFCLVFVPLANAAPGDPDPTFGVGGEMTDYTTNVAIRRVLIQPDGKLIVVGSRKVTIIIGQPAVDCLFIRRYTSTGALDTTYPGLKRGLGYDAKLQADGKLVVLGEAPNTVNSPIFGSVDTTSPVVWRFNTNGTTDTSFGSSGAVFVNSTGYGNSHIEIFAGSIFIAYAARSPFLITTPSYRVSRLSPSGTFDFTVTLPFIYASEKAFSMKVDQSSGDIVVGGTNNTDQNSVLRRYTQNGAVVSSFGTNGIAPVRDCSDPGIELLIKDLVIQPDRKILVHRYTGEFHEVNISRHTPFNGASDGTCNRASVPPYIGQELFLQPDGKYFFFAAFSGSVLRYLPNGIYDMTIFTFQLNPMLVQPDQRLVQVATDNSSFTLYRKLLD